MYGNKFYEEILQRKLPHRFCISYMKIMCITAHESVFINPQHMYMREGYSGQMLSVCLPVCLSVINIIERMGFKLEMCTIQE